MGRRMVSQIPVPGGGVLIHPLAQQTTQRSLGGAWAPELDTPFFRYPTESQWREGKDPETTCSRLLGLPST